jgi:tellurite resistance protein TerC
MISIKTIKRIAILVLGGTVLLLGIALLVLPGPAFIVIPLGLAILAVEFAWARRWLRRMRRVVQRPRGTEAPARACGYVTPEAPRARILRTGYEQ